MDKILSELGYSRGSDLLINIAKKISIQTHLSMPQVIEKMTSDFCNNINTNEVIKKYLLMVN